MYTTAWESCQQELNLRKFSYELYQSFLIDIYSSTTHTRLRQSLHGTQSIGMRMKTNVLAPRNILKSQQYRKFSWEATVGASKISARL